MVDQDGPLRALTVSEILNGLRQGAFWLPHFQRGGVWSDEMGLRLLDSLYLGTPCGSLVTWTPRRGRPEEWGVPITETGGAAPHLYLVDGQQRVRAIENLREALDNAAPRHGDTAPIWLFLPNLPEFRTSPVAKRLSGLRDGLFFRDQDKRTVPRVRRRIARGGGGASVLASDLVRLGGLAGESQEVEALALVDTFLKGIDIPAGQLVSLLAAVAVRARLMLDRAFFVADLGDAEFHEVVDVYNRINTSGMRVDAAERALATLTRLSKASTPTGLRGVLSALHDDGKPPADGAAHIAQRDKELARKREEQLGFKFVLRMMAQALADEDWGALHKWLSFEHFQRDDVVARIKHAERLRVEYGLGKGLEETWRRCAVAARALRAALVTELHCDDFRRIPRGARLSPIVQLLVRFPDHAAACADDPTSRKQLAGLILRRVLADLGTTKEERRLGDLVRRCEFWSNGVRAIRELDVRSGLLAFEREKATTQSRPAQLLYWLIRRPGPHPCGGARDFDYEANGVLLGKAVRNVEESANPECQHMLPAKKLAAALGIAGNARGAGEVSRLGNLTWISAELNGFTKGLGEKIIRLEKEPIANRVCHVYDFNVDGVPAEMAFGRLSEALEAHDSTTSVEVQSAFADAYSAFCGEREKQIVTRFRSWLHELDEAAPALDCRPAARTFAADDHLRRFEERIMDRAAADPRKWDLLLKIAVEVLRPAVAGGEYWFHAHKQDPRWYVLQRRAASSRRKYGTDSVMRVDMDGPALRPGQLDGVFQDTIAALGRLGGPTAETEVRLERLAPHVDSTLRLLSGMLGVGLRTDRGSSAPPIHTASPGLPEASPTTSSPP